MFQQLWIIYTGDHFTLFNIIEMTPRASKNCRDDLVGWQTHISLLRLRFTWRSPFFRMFLGGVFWWIHVLSTVRKQRKTTFGLPLKLDKHFFEVVIQLRFLSIVNKRATHLADSFLITKYLCKTEITDLCDRLAAFSRSSTFTHRSSNIISWILSTISGVVPSIRRPLFSLRDGFSAQEKMFNKLMKLTIFPFLRKCS